MVKARNWITITISKELYGKLKERYEAEKKRFVAFTPWVSDYILERLEEDELLRRHAPFLSFIGAYGNEVHIADYFENRIVEVEFHDQGIGKKIMYCRHCERDDCLHVGFCFAIREVNKALVERGFKQPKVRMKEEEEEEKAE
jgi:hypothetical protein